MAGYSQQNLTGVPSAVTDLGLTGSMSAEEIRQRKKRLMAAAQSDLLRVGNRSEPTMKDIPGMGLAIGGGTMLGL